MCRLTTTLIILSMFLTLFTVSGGEPHYAVSMYGREGIALGENEPFPYVNPEAPKGGRLVMQGGNFTTLNPYSLKGLSSHLLSLIFESPTVASYTEEEPSTAYGHLVESIKVADDRMAVTYKIRPEARFSDNEAVTAEDFVFSFKLIQHPQYNPFYKQYFADVEKAVKIDESTVRFEFSKRNQELPVIMGQLPILPEHIYGAEGKDFGEDFDKIAVGSGPYVIDEYEFGKYLKVRRNPEWWAKDLPRTQGMYNFDTITMRVYREAVARNEAFKGGEYDVLYVNTAKDWAVDFKGEFVRKNYIQRLEIPHNRPVGMQGFVFNLRNPIFQSHKTRYAIAMVFNFPWTNENLFYGQYTRTRCFFENSPDVTNTDVPSGRLLKYLKDLRNQHGEEAVPKMALTQPLRAPGQGQSPATNMRLAGILLDSVGWKRGPDGIRRREGQRLEFSLLLSAPTWVRIAEPYKGRLEKLGVDMKIEVAQPADYQKRTRNFQFDMVTQVFSHSRSIGNEQLSFFSSDAADREGSNNFSGLKNPAVDEILKKLVAAESREELVFYGQTLDRILTTSTLLVPHWHLKYDRLLTWSKFGRPKNHCGQMYAHFVVRDHWWYDAEKARTLKKSLAAGIPMPPVDHVE
ncbi:MAG: extracellular solute-binding protein [Lentisphaeria bacterium]